MVACAVALDPQEIPLGVARIFKGKVDEVTGNSNLWNDFEALAT
jgi:hypothetical protein